MKKNHLITGVSFITLSIILLAQILVQTSCGNPIPPEGGPRDTIPPRLAKASPPEYSTNFSSGRITLTFNEYVDLDNYQQNMLISPLPENFPTVTRKLNVVTIKLRDTLQPNTTYTFDFGKTIKDINEGNVLKDFQYVFSTGPYIDSLAFAGKVILAETGGIDSTLTVMLHTSGDDSAVLKSKPRYISKTNGKGEFVFTNLSPGKYYLYALKDESGVYRMSQRELFAFADSAILVNEETKPVLLYAYKEIQEEKNGNEAAVGTGVSPNIRGGRRGAGGTTDKRLRFQTNLENGTQDLLNSFVISFPIPLEKFDSTKIHFSIDTLFTPVTGYHWKLDTAMKKAELLYTWQPNTNYNFILEKDFATDTSGQQLLKSDTLSFKTKNIDEYGKVTIKFRNLDLEKNPVLLFVLNGEVTNSFPLTSATFTQNMFVPGEYNLRILFDENKNGKWDPGEFIGKHKQPEKVIGIERKVTIRSRWNNDLEISL
jgi:uncharacterized protein (DUF2141 family)